MAAIRVVIPSCSLPSNSGSAAATSFSSRRMIHLPIKARYSEPATGSTGRVIRELNIKNGFVGPMHRLLDLSGYMANVVVTDGSRRDSLSAATEQMYLIIEAIADRVEMHRNIGEQRDNWNALLLNSINMMTLTATTMVGLGAGEGFPLALKFSSIVLFAAATGMLLIMNKIQPSQLAEEQRNAVRLFKQLETEIKSMINIRDPTQADVDNAMERVLALDRAYPLPLLGAMIEKFPKKFEPATWWPKTNKASAKNNHFPSTGARAFTDQSKSNHSSNGWSEELEVEMRAIVDVLKSKDEEDYLRLGNIALKANKALAISGATLTGIAAVASAFAGSSGAATVAAVAGSLAAAVNAMEHGGQVGMVVEMYRNCAGFFRLTAESIEETLEENDAVKRENGELFEKKVALKLGRSLSQLRDLARKSIFSGIKGVEIDEFGSKLI